MSRVFVKICGLTRVQDAELAAELGASALGFVFWPGSPRYVDPATAKAIAAAVPAGVMKVGVFVNEAAGTITRVMDEVGLDVAQLHGQESPELCRALKKGSGVIFGRALAEITPDPFFRGTVIKAVALTDDGTVNIDAFDPDVVLLVDAHDPARHGGTGRTVDWNLAREIAARRPTILAGGLNAANVKMAIRSVQPFGIDVSSGVESLPGVKDPNRLRSFFEALHD